MTRADLEEVMNRLLPFARDMLAKHGEFFPFGAGLGVDGEYHPLAAHTGSERPASQEVIDLLLAGMRRDAAKYRAVGICLDVRIKTPDGGSSDAICVRLEGADGEAIEVFLPYRIAGGSVSYGSLTASRGERRVFA